MALVRELARWFAGRGRGHPPGGMLEQLQRPHGEDMAAVSSLAGRRLDLALALFSRGSARSAGGDVRAGLADCRKGADIARVPAEENPGDDQIRRTAEALSAGANLLERNAPSTRPADRAATQRSGRPAADHGER